MMFRSEASVILTKLRKDYKIASHLAWMPIVITWHLIYFRTLLLDAAVHGNTDGHT